MHVNWDDSLNIAGETGFGFSALRLRSDSERGVSWTRAWRKAQFEVRGEIEGQTHDYSVTQFVTLIIAQPVRKFR